MKSARRIATYSSPLALAMLTSILAPTSDASDRTHRRRLFARQILCDSPCCPTKPIVCDGLGSIPTNCHPTLPTPNTGLSSACHPCEIPSRELTLPHTLSDAQHLPSSGDVSSTSAAPTAQPQHDPILTPTPTTVTTDSPKSPSDSPASPATSNSVQPLSSDAKTTQHDSNRSTPPSPSIPHPLDPLTASQAASSEPKKPDSQASTDSSDGKKGTPEPDPNTQLAIEIAKLEEIAAAEKAMKKEAPSEPTSPLNETATSAEPSSTEDKSSADESAAAEKAAAEKAAAEKAAAEKAAAEKAAAEKAAAEKAAAEKAAAEKAAAEKAAAEKAAAEKAAAEKAAAEKAAQQATAMLRVTSIRVNEQRNGNSWDINGGLPDLGGSVELADTKIPLVVQANLAASTLNQSLFKVRAGDTISITIFDQDLAFADPVGSQNYTITVEDMIRGEFECQFENVEAMHFQLER